MSRTTRLDPVRLRSVAEEAARAGGEIIRAAFGRAQRYSRKGAIDLVTRTDLRSEAAILRVLRRRVPGHAVLAEESGTHPSSGGSPDGPRWIIDPLDGTTNFAHGYPFVCTSVAVEHRGRLLAGAVHDPLRGELFSAALGHGARRNGRRIRVSEVSRVDRALLVTGFPYDVLEKSGRVLREFGAFLSRAQGLRRDGSAALNLCYVACGRFDGFWELRLHPWDVAAGVLIVREAGGRVSRYFEARYDLSADETLASNGRLHHAMRTILRTTRPTRP